MTETARTKLGMDLASDLFIDKILYAGEQGACIPATRKGLEEPWGAKVYDHAGVAEVGAWGFECMD